MPKKTPKKPSSVASSHEIERDDDASEMEAEDSRWESRFARLEERADATDTKFETLQASMDAVLKAVSKINDSTSGTTKSGDDGAKTPPRTPKGTPVRGKSPSPPANGTPTSGKSSLSQQSSRISAKDLTNIKFDGTGDAKAAVSLIHQFNLLANLHGVPNIEKPQDFGRVLSGSAMIWYTGFLSNVMSTTAYQNMGGIDRWALLRSSFLKRFAPNFDLLTIGELLGPDRHVMKQGNIAKYLDSMEVELSHLSLLGSEYEMPPKVVIYLIYSGLTAPMRHETNRFLVDTTNVEDFMNLLRARSIDEDSRAKAPPASTFTPRSTMSHPSPYGTKAPGAHAAGYTVSAPKVSQVMHATKEDFDKQVDGAAYGLFGGVLIPLSEMDEKQQFAFADRYDDFLEGSDVVQNPWCRDTLEKLQIEN
mmetsp:Transcript_42144/g.82446  ORF Transcript_42144/g.82446 Transcript_42144/m.82446 type:complete len:420 (+) Transcript_42144:1031-2290(+)